MLVPYFFALGGRESFFFVYKICVCVRAFVFYILFFMLFLEFITLEKFQ